MTVQPNLMRLRLSYLDAREVFADHKGPEQSCLTNTREQRVLHGVVGARTVMCQRQLLDAGFGCDLADVSPQAIAYFASLRKCSLLISGVARNQTCTSEDGAGNGVAGNGNDRLPLRNDSRGTSSAREMPLTCRALRHAKRARR